MLEVRNNACNRIFSKYDYNKHWLYVGKNPKSLLCKPNSKEKNLWQKT